MVDLASFIQIAFRIMDILILARVILSFFRMDPYHPVVRFIHETTEPILAPIRRIMPGTGMIDFSPMVAWLLLGILENVLVRMIF